MHKIKSTALVSIQQTAMIGPREKRRKKEGFEGLDVAVHMYETVRG